MKIIERNLQEIGASLLVTLPKAWTKSLRLKKGSSVKMLVSEQGTLTIAPQINIEQKSRDAFIKYDEHFIRRFFKEYFEGSEKIKISFSDSVAERGEVYQFLKRFMNVQVIEESAREIVVRCFRIDDLSIEECLRRMYFLSLSMCDAASEGKDTLKQEEMRDTMTRFYYMLVMQVRRFLSEGKYTEQNQISLIRAMDIRMVAEKIQRVGQILLNAHIQSKDVSAYYLDVVQYYRLSVACFLDSNFDKALPLWNQSKKLQMTGENLHKLHPTESLSGIMQIARFGKEISMLVR